MKTSSRPAGVVTPLVALLGLTLLLAACDRVIGPRADFAATPQFDYPPLEVTLDASASSSPNGAIVNYTWDFGDGDTDSGVTVTHTYTEKGVYAITLVVTDSNGETGVRVKQVQALNTIPVAVFTEVAKRITSEVVFRFDASDSFDPDGEIVSYEWDFGDGGSGSGMFVEHSYPREDRSYEVVLTVFDDSGDFKRYRKTLRIDCCGGYY